MCFLQKHEQEVLAVVDKSRQAEQRRRPDEGVKKRSKRREEEEGVHEAMRASLSEGWSLLLRLLDRRQEVLRLAAHFYRRLLEVPPCVFLHDMLSVAISGQDIYQHFLELIK